MPDFPSCLAEHSAADAAIGKVALEAAALGAKGQEMPLPLEAIRNDEAWARTHDINWSKAVVSLVDLATIGAAATTA